MQHLFDTTVRQIRGQQVNVDGVPGFSFGVVRTLTVRLDLVFQRPGRDDLGLAVEAGRAPDRAGLMFTTEPDVRVGDRFEVLSGPSHRGTFEATTQPDPVPGFAGTHHWEIPVKEVAQSITGPAL